MATLMFVGSSLGWIICFWIVVFQPITQSIQILEDIERTKRWLAFYLCFSVLVLPIVYLLPLWVPFRYEIIILMLTCFSSSDAEGAMEIYKKILIPRIEYFTVNISHLKAFSSKYTETHVDGVSSPVASPVEKEENGEEKDKKGE